MARSAYSIEKRYEDDLFIVDLSGVRETMSVTNDAELVTSELYSIYGDLRFYYLDTQLEWAELVHEHGNFLRFDPVFFGNNG